MLDTIPQRRTQAERREQSRQAVLDSALRLFGDKGYAETSLEDIAGDCGLTIRPIYHYFGNKKALFAAVNEVMEQRIIDSMVDGADLLENWHAYLELSEDPAFQRDGRSTFRTELVNAVMLGAFTEAALMIAEADDIALAKREAEALMVALFSRLEDYPTQISG